MSELHSGEAPSGFSALEPAPYAFGPFLRTATLQNGQGALVGD